MPGALVTSRLSNALKELYDTQGFKLEYTEAWTKQNGHRISRDTISQAIRGNIRRMKDSTALSLAEFIEYETKGNVPARSLLNGHQNGYHGKDLRGADLSGEDLSGWDLTGMDLSGANLERTTGRDVKLRFANLTDAKVKDIDMNTWDLTGAKIHTEVENVRFGKFTSLQMSDVSKGEFKNVILKTGGKRSMGMVFPEKFDPFQIKEIYQNHFAIVKLIQLSVGEDMPPAMLAIIDHLIGRLFVPTIYGGPAKLVCWPAILNFILEYHPEMIDPLFSIFRQHKPWELAQRLEISLEISNCSSLEEAEKLKGHPHAELGGTLIDMVIRRFRREEKRKKSGRKMRKVA